MKVDVAIVGGGPAGATSSMFLLREGIKPLIIEQEAFPRYHIGESLTGAGGKVLRELNLADKMYSGKHPRKQGVKVLGQSKRGCWFVPVTGRDENWKLFDQETWQVRRSDFDKMMMEEAISRGAEVIQGKALRPIQKEDGTVTGVRVQMSDGKIQEIQSEVLMDCSGQATWLANLGGITGPKYLGAYDKQIAIFTQVAGAIRDDGPARDEHKDNTLIFYQKKFHWAWFIPLDEEIVSVGVVIPAAYFLEKKESMRDFLTREFKELHPDLARRLADSHMVEDCHVIPNYSYQVKGYCGKGFLSIGDAHRFIDPIFSFGITVAMRESQFAAPAIKRYLAGENRDLANPFAEHQLWCEKGIDILEDSIDSFWEHPLGFALCVYLRYPDHMTDMFAGRIYESEFQPSPALHAFRELLNRKGQREESYVNEDLYSIPIGSRYHPERAPIWEINAEIESTERWMGPR